MKEIRKNDELILPSIFADFDVFSTKTLNFNIMYVYASAATLLDAAIYTRES